MAKKKEINPFRVAKQYLWDGKGDYLSQYKTVYMCICHAITDAVGYGSKVGRQARGMIERRLGDCNTVADWLGRETRVVSSINKRHLTYKNIQFFRHRWLDHLADEWDRGVRT